METGDQQLPPSIDLGRSVSSFYSADQPRQILLLSKSLADDEEEENEGRIYAAAAGGGPSSTVTKPLRSSPPSSSPANNSFFLSGNAQSSSAKNQQRSSSSVPQVPGERLHMEPDDQQKSSSFDLASTATTTMMMTTTGNDAAAVVAEVSLNKVITSLGLMHVGDGDQCSNVLTTDRQQQSMFSSNSNYQNLSPAIYQLLAQSQSQLPVRRWPVTGIQQQQQHVGSGFCPTNFQNNMLFNNVQPCQAWNGNLQANQLSHCNSFNTPWGPNQQSRKANSLPSTVADFSLLLSKLQPKSHFAKNFQQSAAVRTGKTVPEESSADLNQLNHHDAEVLKLGGVDASMLEMSGLSQSQDHLKGFHNWSFAGRQTTQRGISPYGLRDHFNLLENGSIDQVVPNLAQMPGTSPNSLSPLRMEHYSRKVFVGGLPPDIDEEEITASFRRFGPLIVDWPHKAESKSYFPPKGYCFLLFQDELSVQTLIDTCMNEDSKLFWFVSSPTMKDKMVQIRPWNLGDSDFVMDASQPLDPRKTIFVGGVPRPLRAIELAVIMERLYGGVCYAGIDTDPELKYPKGAGRVAFSSQQSYIAAISARFVQLQHGEIDKRVEVKPYVLDDQLCDECQGIHCSGRFAPFFCANVTCLQYYCEHCWSQIHSRPGREFHKPLVKEGADRPRSLPFRWC